jgi:hypothetical protein
LCGEIICDIDDILELILHVVQTHHLLYEFFDILEDARVPPYVNRPFLLKTCRFVHACRAFIVLEDTDVLGEEAITLVGVRLMDR